jgi:hypothetical protein
LRAIKNSYINSPNDESIKKAFAYLTTLAFSAKRDNQIAYLNSHGFVVDANLSILSLVESAKRLITTENVSLEINKIAKDSATRAVIVYHEHHHGDNKLFGPFAGNPLLSIGNGAAFCELTRSFFAAYTEKRIQYYTGRVAARAIGNYGKTERFTSGLTALSISSADRVFETSDVTESFAAEWFNGHAKNSLPSNEEATKFLRVFFNKTLVEFLLEDDEKF